MLKGKVRIAPPSVMQAVDLAPVFLIKDHWFWRLLTACIAYGLALLVYVLTTGVRSRLEHRATRASISLRLARFLATNPAFTDHDSVVFIRQLLLDSEQQDRREDFDVAADTLTSADSRMSQLETTPPAAPSVVNAPSAPEIRVLNAPDRIISGRTLSFQIGSRPVEWIPGSVFHWEIGQSAGNMVDAGTGSEKTSLAHFFVSNKLAANWTIEVTANDVSKSRIIALAADDRGVIKRLRSLNLLPHLLAMVLAVLAAYLATNSAESWGASSDYINLFLASFGVSSGAQSFAVLLQAVRR
jgi:hypothetical protein